MWAFSHDEVDQRPIRSGYLLESEKDDAVIHLG